MATDSCPVELVDDKFRPVPPGVASANAGLSGWRVNESPSSYSCLPERAAGIWFAQVSGQLLASKRSQSR
jgi:hypothetical protein